MLVSCVGIEHGRSLIIDTVQSRPQGRLGENLCNGFYSVVHHLRSDYARSHLDSKNSFEEDLEFAQINIVVKHDDVMTHRSGIWVTSLSQLMKAVRVVGIAFKQISKDISLINFDFRAVEGWVRTLRSFQNGVHEQAGSKEQSQAFHKRVPILCKRSPKCRFVETPCSTEFEEDALLTWPPQIKGLKKWGFL